MSDEKQAALDPLDAFVQEALDQATEPTKTEGQPVESAPTVDAITPEATVAIEPEGDEPKANSVQKRINKITKKAGDAERRADDLQEQLDKLQRKPELTEPTLEGHDYDTDAFNDANVDYKIQEGVKNGIKANSQNAIEEKQKLDAKQSYDLFVESVKAIDSEGMTKIDTLPELQDDVIAAIMQAPNSGELALHLTNNLEAANELATMTPMAAMMELGRISVKMSVKPEIKPSAAPDPIEPVTAGSALSEQIDDDMSIDAWMAKYN